MVCWKDALQMDKLDPEWTQFAVFANHDRVQVDMIRPFVGEDFGYVQELAAPKSSIAWSILECGNFQARCHLSATVIVLKRRIHIVRLVLNTHVIRLSAVSLYQTYCTLCSWHLLLKYLMFLGFLQSQNR